MAHCNLTKKIFVGLTLGILSSCSSYPETPELVLEEFIHTLSSGDCETTVKFCDGEAKMMVQASIDAGCEPYQTEIDSIVCISNGEITECITYETRTIPNASPSVFDIEWPYDLEQIDGKWKIINMEKDHPEWEDEAWELELENPVIDSVKTSKEPINIWLSHDYYPFLEFPEENETIMIFYLGQCMYEYPIERTEDLIEVKYDTLMDCIVDLGFRKKFGVKKPKVGQTFIELKQKNDTIFANYLFPTWTDSLNAQNQSQPLFVEKFVRSD